MIFPLALGVCTPSRIAVISPGTGADVLTFKKVDYGNGKLGFTFRPTGIRTLATEVHEVVK